MNSLSIFGTSSDAGKSTLAFALTYLLHKHGIKVAPFKAQNVSNNSVVTDIDTGEIAIPQAFAAESIGIPTTPSMNPILIKSGAPNKAHLIINGQNVDELSVHEYYNNINTLKPIVKSAFEKLQKKYDCIVAEGAGSPVELNLMDKDLSNIYIAQEFNTKIILVADIERGGVFASIWGVYNLLPKELQKNVIGVIVNKFRGDSTLFDNGVKIIEQKFGIPVLGVIPYKPFNLGFEDAASLQNYHQDTSKAIIKVGIIALPHMSNFTDFEPLVADSELEVQFLTSTLHVTQCDLLILPGSKRVVADLKWLKQNGFVPYLQDRSRKLVAICGGYEMLHETLYDPHHIESDHSSITGVGRLKGSVEFQKQKIVKKGEYNIFGVVGKAYEIHNGVTKKKAKKKKNLYATFLHGIFENDNFRKKIFSKINKHYRGYDFSMHKQKSIKDFALHVEKNIDINRLLPNIKNT